MTNPYDSGVGSAWGIKLGSGGAAVDFCEARSIVGVGWRDIDLEVVLDPNEQALRDQLDLQFPGGYPNSWPGTLRRFVNHCQPGDFLVYYVPQRKSFVVGQICGDAYKRTTDLADETDIWFVRDFEFLQEISTVQFYGPLKGKVLGPRFSFWQLHDMGDELKAISQGEDPLRLAAPDPEVVAAIEKLRALAATRLHALDAKDYETLTADFFRAQGASIRGKPGAEAVIDVHAEFSRGELGPDEWFIQVKRYESKEVGMEPIRQLVDAVGESGRKGFVSAFGFTEEAREFADSADVLLLETEDFVPLALSGRLSVDLRKKLGLPGWTTQALP